MRAHFGAAEAMGLSCACVFVDAINAFATLWARCAVRLPESDEYCAGALMALGLGQAEIADLLSEARRIAEWGQAPDHLIAVVSAFQRHCWTARNFDSGILRPAVGVQAGVPMADVIACMALSVISRRIRPVLLEARLCAPLDQAPGLLAFGDSVDVPLQPFLVTHVGIVDDECFPSSHLQKAQ